MPAESRQDDPSGHDPVGLTRHRVIIAIARRVRVREIRIHGEGG